MGRTKIYLDRNELFSFYWEKGLSPYKIAPIFNCSFSTVRNRLIDYGIALKDNSTARQKYRKTDFSGNRLEKAYLLGFRVGDLNVYKTNKNSKVVVVRCHTTTQEQLDVINGLFSKYGKVTISDNNGSYHVNCFLNETFNFMLEKRINLDQISGEEEFYSFFAGYLDAEGYIGLNQGRARLKIDSYDSEVMKWIHQKLDFYGIRNKTRVISLCSDKRSFGMELWRININFLEDLEKLFLRIKKYCLHRKRVAQIAIAEKNILARLTK
ncbi:MAG: hypothetical protein Q7S64_02355 [bacterium]|nr:hypothetical protein [bacterium]